MLAHLYVDVKHSPFSCCSVWCLAVHAFWRHTGDVQQHATPSIGTIPPFIIYHSTLNISKVRRCIIMKLSYHLMAWAPGFRWARREGQNHNEIHPMSVTWLSIISSVPQMLHITQMTTQPLCSVSQCHNVVLIFIQLLHIMQLQQIVLGFPNFGEYCQFLQFVHFIKIHFCIEYVL